MYILIETFSAAIFLIPVFLLLWIRKRLSFETAFLYFIFSVYLSGVYFLTGLPTTAFSVWDANGNLIPFIGMAADAKNTMLNVALFIPCGFSLPLLWKKYRRIACTLGFGLAMTAGIETLQLFTFRATDINDIITNFAGTCIGYLVFLLAHRFHPLPIRPDRRSRDLPRILLLVAAVMFFLQPLVVSLIYGII